MYLPSTDHPVDKFYKYVNDLASIISALECSGLTIILGDFNAQLWDMRTSDAQGCLLQNVISSCDLYSVSSSSIATGPSYTFFGGSRRIMVDYILVNTCTSY